MKIVVAPDSFKGSMTAQQAADAIIKGLKIVWPQAQFVAVPMADGGEGTVQSLVDATQGRLITQSVTGPLNTQVTAHYGILGDNKTAVIEMASASGIQYVNETNHNPLVATTFGTGELILAALDQKVERIIIGIGGSATNDGGAGMAQALGAHLLDNKQQEIARGGGPLADLAHIDISQLDSRLAEVQIIIASDVKNPLTGPQGASAVFGPQKGATTAMVQTLDGNLKHYAQIIKRDLNLDVDSLPGAGAAGGLGAGLLAFTKAQMQPGIEIVTKYTGLKEKAQAADLVFTGEGGVDAQTKFGKTPYGVAQATKTVAPQAPVVVLTGNLGADVDSLYSKEAIDAIFPILPGVTTLKEAIAQGQANLARTAENIGRLLAQWSK